MYLCNEFKKTELYAKIKDRPSSRQAIAFISGIGGDAEVITDEFNLLVDRKKEVQDLKNKLKELLSSKEDNDIVLTTLAEISIEYIKAKGKK
jgi:hypothetical protein